MNDEILSYAAKLVETLKAKSLKIATAESCTGGMVSGYITAVPGASEVFEMGVTSYSNRIKNKFLNVNGEILDTKGAVSRDTAKQMAENIRSLSGADIGVSVTGVAGPAPQDGYSAGTVFVGICYDGETQVSKLQITPKDRNYVREQTVLKLFGLILENI